MSLLGLLAVLLGRASASAAQVAEPRIPELESGQVATIVIQAPAAADADSATYTLRLEPGFRPFMTTEGVLTRVEDAFLLPVTFATPVGLPAGEIVAGRLDVDVRGRTLLSRDLVIRIRAHREIGFRLERADVGVAPDGVAEIPFRIHNRGNLPDTVRVEANAGDRWTPLSSPTLVVEPGDSALGSLRLAAPAEVSPGERMLAHVTATTTAAQEVRTANLVVVSSAGWLGDLAHVPSSVFIGQALGGRENAAIALSGGGRVAPDTDLRLDLRHYEQGAIDPVLQRQLAGARMRIALTRPGLDVELGDVYGFESTVSASQRQSRGLHTRYDPDGPLSVRILAAVPSDLGGDAGGGHIVHAQGGLETAHGEVSLLVGDMVHPSRGSSLETRTTGAGARWSGRYGAHDASVETGIVTIGTGDTLRRTGPAMDLRYGLLTRRVSGRLRVRRVPGAIAVPGAVGNEISGSLSAQLTPYLRLVGWGYGTEQNRLGTDARTGSRTANLGLRGQFDRLQLQAAGVYSDRETARAGVPFASSRATVRTEGSYSHGALSLQADLELGSSTESERTGAYHALGGSVRWHGQDAWGWIRLQQTRRPGALRGTSLNTGGALEYGPVDLSGGLTSSWTEASASTSLWAGADVDIRRHLTLHLGSSARPATGDAEWTFSLGVSRRLSLPLPFARQPDLHGVIFNDANDNGRRDPGEPGLSGVGVLQGYLRTASDENGRFSFRDATGDPLQIETGRLPLGYVLSPRVVLGTRGAVTIPLLRTATLHLDLFLDRDEDGERDPAESTGAGIVVTLTDRNGREWTVTADSTGAARATGLMPGHYAVTAQPLAGDGRPGAEPKVLLEVELAPGAEAHHTLPVPLRRRTIRMGGTAPGFSFP